jgi:hypothetical protein
MQSASAAAAAAARVGRTLTTREEALLCSYARNAVCTSGRWETRETKSGEVTSMAKSSDPSCGLASVGDVEAEAMESAGVGPSAVPPNAPHD